MNTLIDVLVPVYNGAKTIRGSIASIQRQTVENIRIVIVDDGSSDDTPAILAEIAHADPRVHVITKPNGGIVDALNTGLWQCTAEFIARHDADDLAYPHRFAAQIDFMKANPDCIAVSSSARHIDANDAPLGTVTTPKSPEMADPSWVPCREPYLLHPFLMIRRASMIAAGGYRECQASEDSDLYWRLQEVGRLHNMHDVLGDYRMHGESISGKSIRNGRRMSLGSQLGGLSALRRRSGQTDIVFDDERVNASASAVTLEQFYLAGSRGLNDAERVRLKIAMSAKLMELTSYRPFELDRHDCHFIKAALRTGRSLMADNNRSELDARLVMTASRLFKKHLHAEALALMSWPLFLMLCRSAPAKLVRKCRRHLYQFRARS